MHRIPKPSFGFAVGHDIDLFHTSGNCGPSASHFHINLTGQGLVLSALVARLETHLSRGNIGNSNLLLNLGGMILVTHQNITQLIEDKDTPRPPMLNELLAVAIDALGKLMLVRPDLEGQLTLAVDDGSPDDGGPVPDPDNPPVPTLQ